MLSFPRFPTLCACLLAVIGLLVPRQAWARDCTGADINLDGVVGAADFGSVTSCLGHPVERRGIAHRVARLEAQVVALSAALEQAQEILQFVRVEADATNGLSGPQWIIEGVNVHIRDGSGSTADTNGKGNLLIGYNEDRTPAAGRSGSHNLVIGPEHEFTSYGGLIAGMRNTVTVKHSTVSGGRDNTAEAHPINDEDGYASVSGGRGNTASGPGASVSGGVANVARQEHSSVSGGSGNLADEECASVSGGSRNVASAYSSWVGGGESNSASGFFSAVTGGGKQ